MITLRDVLRAALAETNGDDLAAAGAILKQCEEPLFRQALIAELAPELTSEAPTLRGVVDEAQAAADGDDERLAAILRERNDPRENPKLAAKVGREVRHGLIRVLLAALRDEKVRGR